MNLEASLLFVWALETFVASLTSMLLFWKLVDETQIPKSQECTNTVIKTLELASEVFAFYQIQMGDSA